MDIQASSAVSAAYYSNNNNDNAEKNSSSQRFTAEEQRVIQELKARDLEVRAHEAAHVAAAAGLIVSGASFTYQRGPDGVNYAIGGEVKIDTTKIEGDPEASLKKAQQVRAAALAPASPSSQDRNVAAQAAKLIIEARAELNQQRNNDTDTSSTNTADSLSTKDNETRQAELKN